MDKRDTRPDRAPAQKSAASIDDELQRLCQEADEAAARAPRLDLGPVTFNPGGDGSMKHPDIQVPEVAHQRYYSGWQNVVKKLVSHKEMRGRIFAEGRTFLKENKRKGRDSRMAKPSRLKALNDTVMGWLNDHNGANPSELLFRLMELNRSDARVN